LPGTLFVISGPSGAGKSTLVKKLAQLVPDVVISISATTREPRAGEQDGREYFFISREEFLDRVQRGEFLEWAEVHGNLYGTPAAFVDEQLRAGKSVILEIDVQGAQQVAERRPDAVLIFIEPPDFEELLRRLEERGTENEEERARRIAAAKRELALRNQYHYRVVNDRVERAAEELRSIITMKRSE
jgi:guanylate kinase